MVAWPVARVRLAAALRTMAISPAAPRLLSRRCCMPLQPIPKHFLAIGAQASSLHTAAPATSLEKQAALQENLEAFTRSNAAPQSPSGPTSLGGLSARRKGEVLNQVKLVTELDASGESTASYIDTFLAQHATRGEPHFFFQYVSSQQVIQQQHWRHLLSEAYARAASVSPQQCIRELTAQGIDVDRGLLHEYIQAYTDAGRPRDGATLLKVILEAEQKPWTGARTLYSQVITRLCQGNDVDSAVDLVRSFAKHNVMIQNHLFRLIMQTYGTIKRYKDGSLFFEEMLALGLQPDRGVYRAFLDSYITAGEIKQATVLIDIMESKGVFQSWDGAREEMYNRVFRAMLEQSTSATSAIDFIRASDMANFKFDHHTCDTIASLYSDGKLAQGDTLVLLNSMTDVSARLLVPISQISLRAWDLGDVSLARSATQLLWNLHHTLADAHVDKRHIPSSVLDAFSRNSPQQLSSEALGLSVPVQRISDSNLRLASALSPTIEKQQRHASIGRISFPPSLTVTSLFSPVPSQEELMGMTSAYVQLLSHAVKAEKWQTATAAAQLLRFSTMAVHESMPTSFQALMRSQHGRAKTILPAYPWMTALPISSTSKEIVYNLTQRMKQFLETREPTSAGAAASSQLLPNIPPASHPAPVQEIRSLLPLLQATADPRKALEAMNAHLADAAHKHDLEGAFAALASIRAAGLPVHETHLATMATLVPQPLELRDQLLKGAISSWHDSGDGAAVHPQLQPVEMAWLTRHLLHHNHVSAALDFLQSNADSFAPPHQLLHTLIASSIAAHAKDRSVSLDHEHKANAAHDPVPPSLLSILENVGATLTRLDTEALLRGGSVGGHGSSRGGDGQKRLLDPQQVLSFLSHARVHSPNLISDDAFFPILDRLLADGNARQCIRVARQLIAQEAITITPQQFYTLGSTILAGSDWAQFDNLLDLMRQHDMIFTAQDQAKLRAKALQNWKDDGEGTMAYVTDGSSLNHQVVRRIANQLLLGDVAMHTPMQVVSIDTAEQVRKHLMKLQAKRRNSADLIKALMALQDMCERQLLPVSEKLLADIVFESYHANDLDSCQKVVERGMKLGLALPRPAVQFVIELLLNAGKQETAVEFLFKAASTQSVKISHLTLAPFLAKRSPSTTRQKQLSSMLFSADAVTTPLLATIQERAVKENQGRVLNALLDTYLLAVGPTAAQASTKERRLADQETPLAPSDSSASALSAVLLAKSLFTTVLAEGKHLVRKRRYFKDIYMTLLALDHIEPAQEFLDLAQSFQMHPDQDTNSALFQYYARNRQWGAANELHHTLRGKGFRVPDRIFHNMVAIAVNEGNSSAAMSWATAMFDEDRTDLEPVMSTLLPFLVKRGLLDDAKHVYTRFLRVGRVKVHDSLREKMRSAFRDLQEHLARDQHQHNASTATSRATEKAPSATAAKQAPVLNSTLASPNSSPTSARRAPPQSGRPDGLKALALKGLGTPLECVADDTQHASETRETRPNDKDSSEHDAAIQSRWHDRLTFGLPIHISTENELRVALDLMETLAENGEVALLRSMHGAIASTPARVLDQYQGWQSSLQGQPSLLEAGMGPNVAATSSVEDDELREISTSTSTSRGGNQSPMLLADALACKGIAEAGQAKDAVAFLRDSVAPTDRAPSLAKLFPSVLLGCIKASNLRGCFDILNGMIELNVPPTMRDITAVLQLGVEQDSARLTSQRLQRVMRELSLTPTARFFTIQLDALQARGQFREMRELLDEAYQTPISASHFRAHEMKLVDVQLGRHKALAGDNLQELQRAGALATAVATHSVVGEALVTPTNVANAARYFASTGNEKAMLTIVDLVEARVESSRGAGRNTPTMPDIPDETRLLAWNCLLRASSLKDFKRTMHYADQLRRIGLELDTISMAALLASFFYTERASPQPESPHRFVTEASNRAETTGTVGNECKDQTREGTQIRHMFDSLRGIGVFPTASVFSMLFEGAVALGDPAVGECLLHGMLEQGFVPTTAVGTALIQTYERVGDLQGAEHVLSKMHDAGMAGSFLPLYRRLLHAYSFEGKAPDVTRIVDRMQDEGLQVTSDVVQLLVKAYYEANELDEADNVLHLLADMGCPVPEESYVQLIQGYAGLGDPVAMMAVFESFMDTNVPTTLSLHTVLAALAVLSPTPIQGTGSPSPEVVEIVERDFDCSEAGYHEWWLQQKKRVNDLIVEHGQQHDVSAIAIASVEKRVLGSLEKVRNTRAS